MIRVQHQVDNGRNSSPTLEVEVFLLGEDKMDFFSWQEYIPIWNI